MANLGRVSTDRAVLGQSLSIRFPFSFLRGCWCREEQGTVLVQEVTKRGSRRYHHTTQTRQGLASAAGTLIWRMKQACELANISCHLSTSLCSLWPSVQTAAMPRCVPQKSAKPPSLDVICLQQGPIVPSAGRTVKK